MCGRFAIYGTPAKLKEHFVTSNELDLQPRFNIAPSQAVPVVRMDAEGARISTPADFLVTYLPDRSFRQTRLSGKKY